jgi:hypothetical protein
MSTHVTVNFENTDAYTYIALSTDSKCSILHFDSRITFLEHQIGFDGIGPLTGSSSQVNVMLRSIYGY